MTTFPMSSPFTSHTVATKAQLDQLVTAVNAQPRGYINDARDSTGNVTLATVATDYASTASSAVTFTVDASDTHRRFEITAQARFVPATVAHGNYSVQVAFVSGGSVTLTGATKAGVAALIDLNSTQTGDNGSTSQVAFACPLLAAGTWTAFVVVRREQGGSGSPADYATGFHVAVYDIGSS